MRSRPIPPPGDPEEHHQGPERDGDHLPVGKQPVGGADDEACLLGHFRTGVHDHVFEARDDDGEHDDHGSDGHEHQDAGVDHLGERFALQLLRLLARLGDARQRQSSDPLASATRTMLTKSGGKIGPCCSSNFIEALAAAHLAADLTDDARQAFRACVLFQKAERLVERQSSLQQHSQFAREKRDLPRAWIAFERAAVAVGGCRLGKRALGDLDRKVPHLVQIIEHDAPAHRLHFTGDDSAAAVYGAIAIKHRTPP